jgi:hypothetical protein
MDQLTKKRDTNVIREAKEGHSICEELLVALSSVRRLPLFSGSSMYASGMSKREIQGHLEERGPPRNNQGTIIRLRSNASAEFYASSWQCLPREDRQCWSNRVRGVVQHRKRAARCNAGSKARDRQAVLLRDEDGELHAARMRR